jgi:molybdopterin-guanine dinucleotide biosynthesis protein A
MNNRRFDAAILIGDRGKSRPIKGENKNFLKLDGLPLFFYVLQALEQSHYVRRIFVAGDQNRIRDSIDTYGNCLNYPEKITPLEQGRNLFENAFIASRKAMGLPSTSDAPFDPELEEQALLFLPGDTPLVTPQEIDEFLEKCSLEDGDYFLGMTPEESLKPFYPTQTEKGIKMAYYFVEGKKIRQSNLHLTKPLKIKNRQPIQDIYDCRYQKELMNFVKLFWAFYRTNVRWQGIYYYLMLYWNFFMSRIGLEALAPPFSKLLRLEAIEEAIGKLLGCRFTVVETKLAGGALDIDSEKDYETMERMFERWRLLQQCDLKPAPEANIPLETAS